MGWVGGLAEWVEGDTAYLSIAFTWRIDDAIDKAMIHKFLGRKVVAGGPALFRPQIRKLIEPHAEIGSQYQDAVIHHNPLATRASRGCPAQSKDRPEETRCKVPCIVPAMDGSEFTFFPDFPVRPILCDDNLSALPIEYQRHVVSRYVAEGVPLEDANSGFEPLTFTEEMYRLWKTINKGPWRFAYDGAEDREPAIRVMKMLSDEPAKHKRVYVLIGNEPFEECMDRIREVIEHGCEPYVQPLMKLNARERRPWVRFDWTEQKLKDVTRWANQWVWRTVPFEEYRRTFNKKRSAAAAEIYDDQQGLFVYQEETEGNDES